MSEYKCICCGEVKESDKPCTCLNCGYKMYEVPYDRKAIFIGEIVTFLRALEVREVRRDDLTFEGKNEYDKFPGFKKIQQYVANQEKTELFLKNLRQSVENIQLHYRSSFSNEYKVTFAKINDEIDKHDIVLNAALATLNLDDSCKLDEVKWPDLRLMYTKTVDRDLAASAEELLNQIGKLTDKIEKFIKFNNLYGNGHKIQPCYFIKKKDDQEPDYKELIENYIDNINSVINKKYEVDIFEDGSEQLKTMLTCLWNAIELIMSSPIHMQRYEYQYDGIHYNEAECYQKLGEDIGYRYSAINECIMSSGFLQDKNEDELMQLYNEMIELDSFGYMNLNSTNLIHVGESEKELNKLIGLSNIKTSISKIKAYALSNKDSDDLNIHMCFYGNPGTGKTEVARIIASILYENKILPTNKVVEVDRSGLVGQFVGETPLKTEAVIKSAMGGVLFIDEAYSLAPEDFKGDFGHEAVATLIKAMEDYRGKFCVILAGYRNEMKKMIATNPGFKSRIQFELDFPNYSRDELESITQLMLQNRGYTIAENALNKVLDITDVKRKEPNFANAREIRNILDQVIMCQNLRVLDSEVKELGLVDVNKYLADSGLNLPMIGDGRTSTIMTGEEEFDQLIGLESIKRMIRKIKAYSKKNKDSADFNLHMCFYGNPGTGKTEVARILSRILYDAGVLSEAKLVETDANGLIGKFVGETGPKTQAKIDDAMGGVLFIDEAYGLNDSVSIGSESRGYGEEAISTLIKAMEDNRGKFCVILAGYKNEMKSMLNMNPGFESRLQFTLEFPDYSREELGQIAVKFLAKKNYHIDDDALELMLDITEYYRKRPNFANARTVRNILDQVIMNQNLRTEDIDNDNNIIIEDVKDYLTDEGINLSDSPREAGEATIGFI